MKKPGLLLAAVLGASVTFGTPVVPAQAESTRAAMEDHLKSSPEQREQRKAWHEERKQKWEGMSPDEKAKWREKHEARKAKWDSMTPDEQAAAKEKMKQRREKWESMSPEEREAAKVKWQDHKAKRAQRKSQ